MSFETKIFPEPLLEFGDKHQHADPRLGLFEAGPLQAPIGDAIRVAVVGNGKTVVRGGWGRYRSVDNPTGASYVNPVATAVGAIGSSCSPGTNENSCNTFAQVDRIPAATAPRGELGNGPSGGLVGVIGLGDRAADDEDRRALVECLARRHDALLVGMAVAVGRADAGDDEEALRPQFAGGLHLVVDPGERGAGAGPSRVQLPGRAHAGRLAARRPCDRVLAASRADALGAVP